MATSTCLHRRLLSAILREPSPLPGTYRSSQVWIRTITTSTRRFQAQPSVSFGAENDEMIAQYMRTQPSQKPTKRIKQGKSQKRAASAGPRQGLVPVDDYEISDFIDRSTPQRVPEPAPQATHEKNDTKRSERPQGEAKKDARAQERGTKELWAIQREALKQKFPAGWNPRKKLSPDAMEGIKNLHEQDPERYSTAVLAEQFKISPEAIRRILKSNWMLKQSPEKMQERRERWAKRHDRIWDQQAELGLRPQRKKDTEIEDPEKFERDLHRHEILGSI